MVQSKFYQCRIDNKIALPKRLALRIYWSLQIKLPKTSCNLCQTSNLFGLTCFKENIIKNQYCVSLSYISSDFFLFTNTGKLFNQLVLSRAKKQHGLLKPIVYNANYCMHKIPSIHSCH